MADFVPLSKVTLLKSDRLDVHYEEANSQPDHHLTLNGKTWWCHAGIHRADGRDIRIRFSLKTQVLHVARERRDRFRADFVKNFGSFVVGNSPDAIKKRRQKNKP